MLAPFTWFNFGPVSEIILNKRKIKLKKKGLINKNKLKTKQKCQSRIQKIYVKRFFMLATKNV